MTLAYTLLSEPIRFAENKVCVLVIENAEELRRVLFTLEGQIAGGSGDFVLAENAQIMELSKWAILITDPFSIDFDARKILTKLNQEACAAGEEYVDQFQQILVQLNELAAGISLRMECEAAFSALESWEELIRLLGVHIDVQAMSFPEQIVEYMRLQRKFFGKKLFLFYNLKAVLSEEELRALYRMVCYEKLAMLLIEDVPRKHVSEYEITAVVDKDLCVF